MKKIDKLVRRIVKLYHFDNNEILLTKQADSSHHVNYIMENETIDIQNTDYKERLNMYD
jgi:hypothetical protein